MSYWLFAVAGVAVLSALLYRMGYLSIFSIPPASKRIPLKVYARRIERSQLAIGVTDFEGRYVMVNRRKLKLMRRKRAADVLGRFPWDFSPGTQEGGGSSVTTGLNVIADSAEGSLPEFNWEMVDAEGERFSLHLVLHNITLAEGDFSLCVCTPA